MPDEEGRRREGGESRRAGRGPARGRGGDRGRGGGREGRGGGGRGGGGREGRGGGGGGDAAPQVRVGSTANKPELLETIPIARRPGAKREVVLSFGPQTKTDAPMPDLAPGDRLEVFAELEVTTDAAEPNHPGRIGNAYSYAPKLEAWLLLAAGPDAAKPGRRAIELGRPWRDALSHKQHHGVVVFDGAEFTIPAGGLPWNGPSHVNLALSASHPKAKAGDLLLIGQNEKTPIVVQDMAGIRVVRTRSAPAAPMRGLRDALCLVPGVPVAKRATVVFAHRLDDLEAGEQFLVKARLVTDAAQLGYAARISTRLFLADSPDQVEPGGSAAGAGTWKGHLSKFTGFNCLPEDGPRVSKKFGVLAIRTAPGRPLFVNLVAVSAAPFGGERRGDALPIDAAKSFLEVVRYPPDLAG